MEATWVEPLVPTQPMLVMKTWVELPEFQVMVTGVPLYEYAEGLGVMVSEHDGMLLTETEALCVAVELLTPVHVTVYVVLTVGEAETLPEMAPPVLKLVPAQLDAFVELHEMVDDWPLVIVAGLAEMVAVGAALTVTLALLLALPPAPVQVTV
jgi:hypothetical protein